MLAYGAACVAADQDGLHVALAAKPKVFISVVIAPELSSILRADQIKDDAELLLRQNQIAVVTGNGDGALGISIEATGFTPRPGGATIYAVVPTVRYSEYITPNAGVAKCLTEGTKFDITLACLQSHSVFVELWRTHSVLQVGDSRVLELRGNVKDMVQKFVLEYVRAN